MNAREFLRSLLPGDDRELAAALYVGRESASDEAARKRRVSHAITLAKTAPKGDQSGGGA